MKWLKFSTALLTTVGLLTSVEAWAEDKKGAGKKAAESKEAAAPAKGQAIDQNTVVGKVNNQTIRIIDVMERLNALPPQMAQAPIETLFPQVLQQMAARIAIAKKAREKGVEKTAQFKKVKQEMETNLLQEMYLFGDLKQSYSDDELKAEYDVYMKEFVVEDQIKARHILVKEEKEAQEILKRLKDGEEFAKVASEKSLDTGTARNGGDLGFFGQKDLIPEFTNAAFALENGKMTESPIKTPFGYHIILREDSRKSEPLAFEKAKAGLLPNRLRQKEVHARYKEAMDGSKIELTNIDGSPLKMGDMLKPGMGAPAKVAAPSTKKASEATAAESKEEGEAAHHATDAEGEANVEAEAEATGEKAGQALKE